MMDEIDFPLYQVVDEGTGDVLVAAEELEGFFVDSIEAATEVMFVGTHEVSSRRRRTEDAVLEIKDRERKRIGWYFIGRVALGNMNQESAGGKASVSYRFFGNHCEYPGAGKIWRRWASDVALEEGEWLQWPLSYHDSWLHVVQNSWFATNHRTGRYGASEVAYLDGSHISSKAGFYCELGEAVNGPGGYFGSNLDALADCIASSSGEGPPRKIVWRNFQISANSLDDTFLDSILSVMREFDIDVVTS